MPKFLVVNIPPGKKIEEKRTREIVDFYQAVFDDHHFIVFLKSGKVHGIPDDIRSRTGVKLDKKNYVLPVDEKTREKAIFFHHPEKTYQILDRTLNHPGSVRSLLVDSKSDELLGMFIGTMTTLSEAFDLQGWANPITHYADVKLDTNARSHKDLLSQINRGFNRWSSSTSIRAGNFSLKELVFCPNCLALADSVRGSDAALKLYKNFCASIPNDENTRYVFETTKNSMIYTVCRSAGMIAVDGTLLSHDAKAKAGDKVFTIGDYRTFMRTADFYDRAPNAG